MKCLNYLCNNKLLDFRVKKISSGINRWRFCIPCLKRSYGEPLRYECHRKYCNKMIKYQDSIYNQSRKYCSDLCKHRNQFKTKPPSVGYCLVCENPYVTNLGRPQKYCGKKCRDKENNRKYNSKRIV